MAFCRIEAEIGRSSAVLQRVDGLLTLSRSPILTKISYIPDSEIDSNTDREIAFHCGSSSIRWISDSQIFFTDNTVANFAREITARSTFID